MVFIDSKNIIIIIVGALISLLLALFPYEDLKLNDFNTIYFIIIAVTVGILGIVWVIGTKTKEINEKLDSQATEQQKINERLKIYEQLIDIKAEIKDLQREVFKNGKRK